jgi:hypothetical protein
MSDTRVYVPAGSAGGHPAFVEHVPLGQTNAKNFGIAVTALRPNIPGVDLRQVQSVNGAAVDVGTSANYVDMNPRTHVLKK